MSVPFDRAQPRPGYLGPGLLPGDAWRTASLSERAVHVARSQERNKVHELTPNWGGMVTVYLRVAGWSSPAPWCAAFVYWCLVESGADRKALWKYPASTRSLATWAKARGVLSQQPRRGDVFVWNKGTGHTGFIVRSEPKKLTTIEGNTNASGGREGVAVLEKVRTVGAVRHAAGGHGIWGFVRLD